MKRLLIVLALAGCVTTEEISNLCTADYGFKAGTDAHGGCMLQLQGRADDRRQRLAAALIAADTASARSGSQQCTYSQLGNTVYQNCY